MILDKVISDIHLLKNQNLFDIDGLQVFNNYDLNDHQKHTQTIQLSISAPNSLGSFSEDEYVNIYTNQIKSEIAQCIYKKIHSYIIDNAKVCFIDLLDVSDNSGLVSIPVQVINFQNGIYDIEYKCGKLFNIIGSGRIVSEYIVDSSVFSHNSLSNKIQKSFVIQYIGNYGNNIKIYTDPFLGWKNEYIISFREVMYNLGSISTRIISEATFQPKLVIDLDLSFLVFDPLLIYVIDNNTSDAYNKYKSERRNKKIDNILGE
jgi:hypothetical protein